MIIIINGMVAALKEKSTFEFISENRYFSDRRVMLTV